MAAQANITVFDGAATPVTHSFTPAGALVNTMEGLVAEWREILASVPTYAQAKIRTTQRQLKSGVWRVAVMVMIPVMESISGQNSAGYTAAPKVAYTNTVGFIGYFDQRATTAERRLARQMLVNLMNNVSTTVAAATTGFAPDLVDANISVS